MCVLPYTLNLVYRGDEFKRRFYKQTAGGNENRNEPRNDGRLIRNERVASGEVFSAMIEYFAH